MDGMRVYQMLGRFLKRTGIAALVLWVLPAPVLADPGETLVAVTSGYEMVSYRAMDRKAVAAVDSTLLQPLLGEIGIRELSRLKSEVQCLAQNVYFEARSESEDGQRAVGHVVMNRVTSRKYPDSVCEVVHQGGEMRRNRCQFSWWCDGRSDQPRDRRAWQHALKLAYEIYFGLSSDPTNGALWYHATYVDPYWNKLLVEGDRIGQHVFYHSRERARELL